MRQQTNINKQNQQNNSTNSQIYSNGNQIYGQTPGGTSEIRNFNNSKNPSGFDQEYYNSNFPYQQQQQQQYQQQQQSQQGLYNQWNDGKNQNYQQGSTIKNNQQGNQVLKNDISQSYNNQDKYQQQRDNSKNQQQQIHNIYQNKVANNDQTNFYQQNNNQKLQEQSPNFNFYTPNPEMQKKNPSQIRQTNQQNLQQQENRTKQGNGGQHILKTNYVGQETPIGYDMGFETPNKDKIRLSQNKQDSNDPNLEDLQASILPVSLPVKIQGNIQNNDQKINQSNIDNRDMTFQANSQFKMNQFYDNQRQSQSSNTSNILLINEGDNQREQQQQGYFYQQNSQQKINNNQQKSEIKNLRYSNSNDLDDDINNSNNTLNSIVPQTINYHPSKSKVQKDLQQKNSNQQEIINLIDSQYQEDNNNSNNLLFSNYKRESNNDRLYNQYSDINNNNNNNQQRDADFYRSDNARKESLFKYDPSMFQSVTGYFYPSVGTQQAMAARFDEEEAKLNLNKQYKQQPQKLQLFQHLIQHYLVETQRVFIQKINREISGLQSAENLGDFFIRKYNNNLQKRAAGCSRAQIFPVYIGVRGDGNCFYRALIVNYLVILLSKYENIDQFEQLIFDIYYDKIQLIDLEYQGHTRSDSSLVKIILMQQLLIWLTELLQVQSKEEISLFLMKMFDTIASDHDFDYSLVVLCRSMILYALEKYGSHQVYQEYLLQEDIEQTRQKLYTYKEDAEFHVISLSTEIFRHPIQIIQVQKDKFGNFELNEKVVYSPNVNKPLIGNFYFLLNEGHYDLVFDRETCLDYFPSLSLFKNHKKYHDDLQILVEQTNTQENLKQHYIKLMVEYEQFLKDQNNQAVKIRESFINLQTLYQTKIGRMSSVSQIVNNQENQENIANKGNNQQNHLLLFDSVITQSQSQVKGLDTSHLIQSDSKKTDILANSNDKLFSNRDGENISQNLFMKKQSKQNNENQFGLDNKDQKQKSNTQQDIQTENLNLQTQTQMKSTEDTFYHPFQGQGESIDFKSNFYNLHSDKLQKQQNFCMTPCPPSVISDIQKKDQKKQIQQQNNSILFQCDHAFSNNVLIKSITCCKINYEVCYPCFKTRQIILCQNCKKEILSNSRIAQTCKNKIIHCTKCDQKTELIILFNKIYCKTCISNYTQE